MGRKTCASASQPSRSSRCGQSVGTDRKLPRWPQVMLRQSWLTSSSRALEPAGARRVGVHDAADQRRTLVDARDLDVAEAVEREARLEDLVARRRAGRRCRAGARRAGWRGAASRPARASRRSAAARGAALALDAQPHPADHVLAEVDDVHARRRARSTATGSQLLGHADRLRALGDEPRPRRARAPTAAGVVAPGRPPSSSRRAS